ncbi:MAG: ABC transporter permease [Candidatus Korobacteraceae bacterium]
MGGLLQDVTYGFRVLRKSPVFTLVAVLTLALGIGANTAIFSIFNAVLLRPLPYPHPEQLVALGASKPNFQNGSISYPNFRDWQKDNRTFDSLAVFRSSAYSLTGLGDAEEVPAELISSDLFPMLNVQPVVGRLLMKGEDEIGAAPVALIGAGLWARKFGSSPSALGKSITLDGRDYTIVGVIPASFNLSIASLLPADVYVPIGQWSNSLLTDRGAGLGIHGVGRLKPGVTLQQARADMARVTQNLADAYPDKDHGIGAHLVPLQQAVVGHVRPLLLVLLGAVGVVLLIACGNVANLLLARAASRSHEFAIRIALGASRGRLLRQLLTESLTLAFFGGALGLAVAYWGMKAALHLLPATLPRADNIGLDGRVLLFTAAVSLLAGVLFGLAPALKASRPGLNATLADRSRGSSAARPNAQRVFVVLELAMALVLMICAGLMVRSLIALWGVDPGFRSDHILTFGVTLPPSMMKASADSTRASLRNLDQQLNATPGVQASSVWWGAFPMYGDDEVVFWIEGQPKPASQNQMNWALNYVVGPEYLQVMGTELLRGRFLTAQDDEHAPHVVVIDEALAHKFFPHEDPIGKRLNLVIPQEDPVEIVGVVRHVVQWGLDTDSGELQAQLYRPFMQLPDREMAQTPSGVSYAVRFSPTAHTGFDTIRRRLQQGNAEQAVYTPQTMDEIISATLATQRLSMILLSTFAVLALTLASIGIYGVISYVVAQRTQEIGIRMAMGAGRGDVLKLVAGQGLKLIVIGLLCGTAGALAATRALSSMLFGVKPFDLPTFLATAFLLLCIGMLAIYVPAARAAKVDPMVALRNQ